MGLLVDGVWRDQWYDTEKTGGQFVRESSTFRDWISADGSNRFKAEPDRYHLYVSLACPWASRSLIFLRLKELEGIITVSIVHPHMGENGWTFDSYPRATGDQINGCRYLYEIYLKANPSFSGRASVPVLWDKKLGTIVSNVSADIIRMLGHAFDRVTGNNLDFYPRDRRGQIDAINERVYDTVNNGVYKAGFATTQKAYESAFDALFDTLDWLDGHLAQERYLIGKRTTEADWRLFTTLARFDAVYHGHFKCNRRRLVDYPALWPYFRDLYQVPGIAETVDLDHIKRHYYTSHPKINPNGIIPKGPKLDFSEPHGRANL
jgi:putative glutathione S-transferase